MFSHSSMCVVSQSWTVCDLHPNHPWWCAVDPESNVCDWSCPSSSPSNGGGICNGPFRIIAGLNAVCETSPIVSDDTKLPGES